MRSSPVRASAASSGSGQPVDAGRPVPSDPRLDRRLGRRVRQPAGLDRPVHCLLGVGHAGIPAPALVSSDARASSVASSGSCRRRRWRPRQAAGLVGGGGDAGHRSASEPLTTASPATRATTASTAPATSSCRAAAGSSAGARLAPVPFLLRGPLLPAAGQAGVEEATLVGVQRRAPALGPHRQLIEPGSVEQVAGLLAGCRPLGGGPGQSAVLAQVVAPVVHPGARRSHAVSSASWASSTVGSRVAGSRSKAEQPVAPERLEHAVDGRMAEGGRAHGAGPGRGRPRRRRRR